MTLKIVKYWVLYTSFFERLKSMLNKSGYIIEILIYTYITNRENCVLCE